MQTKPSAGVRRQPQFAMAVTPNNMHRRRREHTTGTLITDATTQRAATVT